MNESNENFCIYQQKFPSTCKRYNYDGPPAKPLASEGYQYYFGTLQRGLINNLVTPPAKGRQDTYSTSLYRLQE